MTIAAIMAVVGQITNKGENLKLKTHKEKWGILMIVCLALENAVLYASLGNVCCATFYQHDEPDMHELFERSENE